MHFFDKLNRIFVEYQIRFDSICRISNGNPLRSFSTFSNGCHFGFAIFDVWSRP